MSAGSELSSIATALAELTGRVGSIAESLSGTERDELAGALFEVERALTRANRRLDRALADHG